MVITQAKGSLSFMDYQIPESSFKRSIWPWPIEPLYAEVSMGGLPAGEIARHPREDFRVRELARHISSLIERASYAS